MSLSKCLFSLIFTLSFLWQGAHGQLVRNGSNAGGTPSSVVRGKHFVVIGSGDTLDVQTAKILDTLRALNLRGLAHKIDTLDYDATKSFVQKAIRDSLGAHPTPMPDSASWIATDGDVAKRIAKSDTLTYSATRAQLAKAIHDSLVAHPSLPPDSSTWVATDADVASRIAKSDTASYVATKAQVFKAIKDSLAAHPPSSPDSTTWIATDADVSLRVAKSDTASYSATKSWTQSQSYATRTNVRDSIRTHGLGWGVDSTKIPVMVTKDSAANLTIGSGLSLANGTLSATSMGPIAGIPAYPHNANQILAGDSTWRSVYPSDTTGFAASDSSGRLTVAHGRVVLKPTTATVDQAARDSSSTLRTNVTSLAAKDMALTDSITQHRTGLAGKANTTHTHAESDVTNLAVDLGAKLNSANLYDSLKVRQTILADTMSVDSVNWAGAQHQYRTLGASRTFYWKNLPALDPTHELTIMVEVTASGSYTITWPAGITWKGGSSPTQTASKTDLYIFIKRRDKIYGAAVQNF